MLIVGLGSAGCNIAKYFEKEQKGIYHVELLDEGRGIKQCSSVEEYDLIEYKPRKKVIKEAKEGILIVCGSGKISGATLRVLKALQHVDMRVIYIIPDLEFATEKEKLRHKVHFGVLQEYSRSGKYQK